MCGCRIRESGLFVEQLNAFGIFVCISERKYRILVGKPEGKRPLERPRRRWEDGLKMDLREIGWGGGVEWIHLAQDRDRWRAVVNAVMNLWVLAP
jgi:hypothetical protein